MDEITFDHIRKSQDGHRIEITVQIRDRKVALYFLSNDIELDPFSEALIAATILPAMKLRIPIIRVDGEVSPLFLQNIEKLQSVFTSWKPTYGRVEIKSSQSFSFERQNPGKTGLFFSAGVDSYYAFLTQKEHIDALIYLDGFDVPLKYTNLRERLHQNIERISQTFNFPILTIETNLKDLHDPYLSWSFSHGSGLAAAGYLLAAHFSKLWIAPSGNPALVTPFGTHPDLDSKWSSDFLTTDPAPGDIERIEKLRFLGQFGTVPETLHICLKFNQKAINCGRCAKCLRTLVYMQAAGVYERFLPVFEKPLDPGLLARFHNIGDEKVDLLFKAYAILKENGLYTDTTRALESALNPNPIFIKIKNSLRKWGKPLVMRK